MKRRRSIRVLVAMAATTMLLAAGAGSAQAVFPNFAGCPTETPEATGCIDVQSVTGSLEIKGFTVPLGESLEIRGAINGNTTPFRFTPPAGTNGFFSRAIRIPGGILGIEFPIPGNAVLAIAQLAGPASSIAISSGEQLTVSIPVKVKLENPILGSGCYIGTNSNPSRINLTTGTTSPPSRNRPISGEFGEVEVIFEGERPVIEFLGQRVVDNSFAVPGASGCGLLGIVDPLVNLRLRLPSAAGNNAMIVRNNVAIKSLG